MKPEEIIAEGRRVVEIELEAVRALKNRINKSFADAVEILYECKGRVVFTGMGKSVIIARKIAANMASTGTPSFFLHQYWFHLTHRKQV
jgi:arabinose-5-phosphate isomerase